MTDVENLIYQFEGAQRALLLFFHNRFINDYLLTDRITFKNPCYYRNSWICYLKPLKNGNVELAFLRGNELSNSHGLLKGKGRKQLRSIEIADLNDLAMDILDETMNEAIHLDETVPYESKRKK